MDSEVKGLGGEAPAAHPGREEATQRGDKLEIITVMNSWDLKRKGTLRQPP